MANIPVGAADNVARQLDLELGHVGRDNPGAEALPRRLSCAFIEDQYLNAGFNTEGLEPSRCVLVIAQLLANLKWYRWSRLFKPWFNPEHWHLASYYYWGENYEQNPDWQIWYQARKQADEDLTVQAAYAYTARIIRKYFLDPMVRDLSAALLVKLYVANFTRSRHEIILKGTSWGRWSQKYILGRYHLVWLQRIILPRELLPYYRYAIAATTEMFEEEAV